MLLAMEVAVTAATVAGPAVAAMAGDPGRPALGAVVGVVVTTGLVDWGCVKIGLLAC
jgi:hypothetical protein